MQSFNYGSKELEEEKKMSWIFYMQWPDSLQLMIKPQLRNGVLLIIAIKVNPIGQW